VRGGLSGTFSPGGGEGDTSVHLVGDREGPRFLTNDLSLTMTQAPKTPREYTPTSLGGPKDGYPSGRPRFECENFGEIFLSRGVLGSALYPSVPGGGA
jgi:hypothetical protein